MKMIDIHGHYAWDVDDGIQTKEDSIQALKKARSQGIAKIVATPHVVPMATNENDLIKMKETIQQLKEIAKDYEIEVKQGCELFLNHDYLDSLDKNILIPIEDTNYLLVEFDVRKELENSNDVEDRLYEITIAGYKVIIAHLERYFHESIDLDRVRHLFDQGYVIQINASSILGYQGKIAQKNALALLNKGYVHVIASDTHRPEGRRSPNLHEAYDFLKSKKFDEETLSLLFYHNPLHLLKNEQVEDMKVKQSFFQRLWKGGK